jgi:hypothetical protein
MTVVADEGISMPDDKYDSSEAERILGRAADAVGVPAVVEARTRAAGELLEHLRRLDGKSGIVVSQESPCIVRVCIGHVSRFVREHEGKIYVASQLQNPEGVVVSLDFDTVDTQAAIGEASTSQMETTPRCARHRRQRNRSALK